MWRVTSGGLVSARGTSVRQLWRGLPPDLQRLQAVLERQSDHAIIFISGIYLLVLHMAYIYKQINDFTDFCELNEFS